MGGIGLGLAIFALLFGAAMAALHLHPRLPERHRDQGTQDVIRLAVGMIVVMTSLLLSILTTSVKESFDALDRSVRRLAAEMVLLDRALHLYGPAAAEARGVLRRYAEGTLEDGWPARGTPPLLENPATGELLNRLHQAVWALPAADADREALKAAAVNRLRAVTEGRWAMIEGAGGTLSPPFIGILVGWLTLIFASFGYNAPVNRIVTVTLLLCTASIAAAMFLIIEMDQPFHGILAVPAEPLQRALEHMRR